MKVKAPKTRDNFNATTIRLLRERVSNLCSKPDCKVLTIGAGNELKKVVNVGVAAHITAAAVGGPRYNCTLTPEQRRSYENGIWLCQTCSRLIDVDEIAYPVSLLNKWKADAENYANEKIGKPLINKDESPLSKDLIELLQQVFDKIKAGNNDGKKLVIDLIEKGKLKEAEAQLDNLTKSTEKEYASDLVELSKLYLLTNKDKSLECYTKAVAANPADFELSHNYGIFQMNLGKITDAELTFKKSLALAKDNKNHIEYVIGNMGVLYKNNGKLEQAITYLKQAISLAKENCNDKGYVKHLNNLGSCYFNSGDHKNASEKLQQSLSYVKKLVSSADSKDEKQELKLIQSNILTNLAINLRLKFLKEGDLSLLEKAESHLLIAIEIAETLDQQDVLGRHYGNIANIYRLKKEHKKNRKNIELALGCFREQGTEKDVLTAMLNLGISYSDEGEQDKAIIAFFDCLERNSNVDFPKIYAYTLSNLACSYKEIGNHELSSKYQLEANSLFTHLGLQSDIDLLSTTLEDINKEKLKKDGQI